MKWLNTFYLTKTFFIILGVCVLLFSLGLLSEVSFLLGKLLLFLLFLAVLAETILLYSREELLSLQRKLPNRLSNGDENTVLLQLRGYAPFALELTIFEDLPEQLQIRLWERKISLKTFAKIAINYTVKPTVRGSYCWRNTYILARTNLLGLVARKIIVEAEEQVACYPSFEQLGSLPISTMVNSYSETNYTQVRKIGQSLEFEQIKDYVRGDDYRHINWKASGKQGQLMLNQYQEERSQDIYCLLDLGRSMKMPFNRQTLLDYAINGSLALSKAILTMNDKAGILSFSSKSCTFLPAKSDGKQFGKINEMLYNVASDNLESDYERLYKFVRYQIKQRNLLIIFTNFDSINSLYRVQPYLRALAKYHLVLVVFFENSEVMDWIQEPAKNTREIYAKTIGQNFLTQNRLILKELNKFGIQGLITQPHLLNIQTINQYIQIKKKQMI